LIPKGRYAVSVWVHLLLAKFASHRALGNAIEALSHYDLDLPQGMITDGRHVLDCGNVEAVERKSASLAFLVSRKLRRGGRPRAGRCQTVPPLESHGRLPCRTNITRSVSADQRLVIASTAPNSPPTSLTHFRSRIPRPPKRRGGRMLTRRASDGRAIRSSSLHGTKLLVCYERLMGSRITAGNARWSGRG